LKILVINPGAVSTKIAVFEDETAVFSRTLSHSAESLSGFSKVTDQCAYRKSLILSCLTETGYCLSDFQAVCGRGGLLRHIPSGTYLIDEDVLHDLYNPPYGEHAANLGGLLAYELAQSAGLPAFFVDPVSVDELEPVARISGFCGMERESFFHALNQKSVARRAAKDLGKPYEALNLIVVHLGGGVSVAAHQNGRIVDNFNVKDDGSMGMDRGGSLPVNAVINLCFSGLSKAEVKRKLGHEAGVFSYLGTTDFREVETRAFSGGNEQARLIFEALAYQLAKDIGAMAAVLHFRVDAIVYTGGMAHSERFCDTISGYVGSLAPVLRYPGEEEMRSLAAGALRVLRGEAPKRYAENIRR